MFSPNAVIIYTIISKQMLCLKKNYLVGSNMVRC